jgi:putative spermidine/putrescine transport system substrate-binding protein
MPDWEEKNMKRRTKKQLSAKDPTSVTRRKLLKISLSATALTFAPAVIRRARAASDVIVASWGGAYTQAQRTAFFDSFEKDTGSKVVIADFDLSKLQLMVESKNVEWDLITGIQAEQAYAANKNNLIVPINYGTIDKGMLVPGTAGDYFVAAEWYSALISWNNSAIKSGTPAGWADFWDTTKFPGPRALGKEAVITLGAALLADGADPKKLFPIDYDRAFKSLDKIKKDVSVWYTANGQPPQLLVDGQVVMSSAYNGRIQSEIDKGAPLGYSWDQNIANKGGYTVPRGAKNEAGAMQLIAYCLDAKRQAEFAKLIPYGVTNKQAFDYLDPKRRAVLPTAPENIDKAILIDPVWVGDNLNDMTSRLDKYVLG